MKGRHRLALHVFPLLVAALLLPTACGPLAKQRTEIPTPVRTTVLPTTALAGATRPKEGPTFSPPVPTTAIPTAAPPPAATAPLPTVAATPAEGPVILYFRANVGEADPGDTIVLEWESTGGSRAVLLPMLWPGHPAQSGWEVPLSGAYTYTIPAQHRNSSEIELWVHDEAGRAASALLIIRLRCSASWFFSPTPDICPTDPVFSRAAEQHFERGVMIWVEEEDQIIVMYRDERSPKWIPYPDEWDEGEPEYDPALVPPAGLYQPVRGFGLVWRESDEARERLGWAVGQEMSFDTVIQTTTLYKYNATYIRAPDGNVWHLWPELSGWEKIQVLAP